MQNAAIQYRLQVPSAKRYLGDVRRFVEAYVLQAGFPPHEVEHLKLAIDEGCTNIIEHAYQNLENQLIEVILQVDEKAVTVTLRHSGIPFDTTQYQRPYDLRASINARKGGGWGVYLMTKLMDKVEYRSSGDINEVCLTKFRT